jgi:hypothetical protein
MKYVARVGIFLSRLRHQECISQPHQHQLPHNHQTYQNGLALVLNARIRVIEFDERDAIPSRSPNCNAYKTFLPQRHIFTTSIIPGTSHSLKTPLPRRNRRPRTAILPQRTLHRKRSQKAPIQPSKTQHYKWHLHNTNRDRRAIGRTNPTHNHVLPTSIRLGILLQFIWRTIQ